MKTVTLRLPDQLAADLETEARARSLSVSEVMRERLSAPKPEEADPLASIRDLIGSVDDDLPADVSSRKKAYLASGGYGRNRTR